MAVHCRGNLRLLTHETVVPPLPSPRRPSLILATIIPTAQQWTGINSIMF